MALIEKLTAIGDAVRAQTGLEEGIALLSMADAVAGLPEGSLDGPILRKSLRRVSDSAGIVESIGYYTFYVLTSLVSASFPAALSVGGYAFYGCSGLSDLNLDAAESFGPYALAGCTSLTELTLPCATSLGYWTFRSCKALTSLTLGAPSVCSISSNTFQSSALANGTGMVYVPADLVESYQADSVWSAYADYIAAIEE